LFAEQLNEAVLFGGGDAELERAALYAADLPADALAWVKRTRNSRDEALYKVHWKPSPAPRPADARGPGALQDHRPLHRRRQAAPRSDADSA
jgi:hypothetical protein